MTASVAQDRTAAFLPVTTETVAAPTESPRVPAVAGPPPRATWADRHHHLAVRLLAAPGGVWRLRPGPRPRLSGDRLAASIRRYLAWQPMEQIARAAEVSVRTLRTALRNAGVGRRAPRRAQSRPAAPSRRQAGHSSAVLEMAQRAMVMRVEPGRSRKRLHREIAAALGVTRARVGQLLEIAAKVPGTQPIETGLANLFRKFI